MSLANVRAITLPNPGVVIGRLDPETVAEIKKETTEIQTNFELAYPHNEYLAGNIVHEYTLLKSRDVIEKPLFELLDAYRKQYGLMVEQIANMPRENRHMNLNLKMGALWANFQQKGEFNPIHCHTGVYSFVIWLEIPYLISEERAVSPGKKSSSDNAGCFQFSYNNILGKIVTETIDADSTYGGQMMLFPAGLHHSVYPFYSSDKYRISISGNLY
jgi:hypothetical protein